MGLPWSFDSLQELTQGELQARLQENFDALVTGLGSATRYGPWVEVGSGGTAPAFQNSWVNYGAGQMLAKFYKDAGGVVRLTGIVKSGTLAAAIFTMPAGYRPSADVQFPVSANGLFGYAYVNASGAVVLQSGSTVSVDLTPISFRAEQ